ncbi:MAG: hypothetical protein QNJ54_33250 [Prochloraceae cyanobacterium]|nr:hypothetical protein [Prochloraceae cyanobacterium]
MSQFYQLRLDEAIADYKAGLITATGLLKYYIRIRFAPGWQIILNPIEVCKLLGLAKPTFYKALAKLKQLGWRFGKSVQIIGESDTRVVENTDPTVDKDDPIVNNDDPIRDSAATTGNKIIRSSNKKAETPSQSNKPSDLPDSSPDNNQSFSNSLSDSLAEKPKKSNYRDFWGSLATEEREKFLAFVKEKTKHFSNPIVHIHDYLASKNRWQEFYKNFRLVAQLESEKARDWTTHPDWEKALKSMQKNSGMFLQFGSSGCEHLPREVRRAMRDYFRQQILSKGDRK